MATEKVDLQDKVKVGPLVLENTQKRDYLIKIEKAMQKRWADEKVFEINAPTKEELGGKDLSPKEIQEAQPKWMGTFPYPYMNGSLHLGHAFTVSKIEFAAGFERMRGKRALFPMGLHCSGMPIKSASDKLIREMEMFGEDFSGYDPEAAQPEKAEVFKSADVTKATKGKIANKATGLTYQFQIMESIGVPRAEIKKFADPLYWLEYFPPIARADCTDLGARIDWRRSFITTDVNPFYDSFVRWQMNKLHATEKIKFGRRNTIYSPKDGQPCMDHDRSSGEAVGPQEYTGLKMTLVQWSTKAQDVLNGKLEGKKVSLVAATLRSETVYGQTNCFVGPSITYGVFQVSPEEVYVMTDRAARNMAFQGIFEEEGKVVKLAEIKGSDLVGTKVAPPLSQVKEVYVVPMEGVLATKGTGIVTCCTSDSPDDYATILDLRKKPEYYGIEAEWVANEPISLISTPKYGDLIAVSLVKQFKIQSQKDVKALAEAKEIAYKEGFFSGTMLVGLFKGETVQAAKPKVQQLLVEQGLAFKYAEPENLVMSRSGDECVVALVDQWYIDYGESEWRKAAETLLARMNTYFPETRHGFEGVLAWLKQWACSRSYGLGSKIPWDPQFLVESLSDSTIYMSYYTVAHLLQGGDITGHTTAPLGITPEDMTDEVWDYVLGSGPFPKDATVAQEKFDILKREFNYFYPMDVRSSGKDLIPNHLTFCIYVHAALFPEHHWPLSMRANGHLMLNGKKMAKSTGNSLTLRDAIEKFGADATRLTLADAGDGMEDANFEELTANSAIQRLHTQIIWANGVLSNPEAPLRTGAADSFWDKAFAEEMFDITERTREAYDKTWYKEALQYGYYELDSARKAYTEATSDIKPHRELIERCLSLTALLVAPIAPHFADHIWTSVLQHSTSIQLAQLPPVRAADPSVLASLEYTRSVLKDVRDRHIGLDKAFAKFKKSGGKNNMAFAPPPDRKLPLKLRLFIAKSYPEWQNQIVQAVKDNFNAETGAVDDVKVREALAAHGLLKNKKAMPYVVQFKKRITDFGAEAAFSRTLPFDELEVLKLAVPKMQKELNLVDLEILTVEEALATLEAGKAKDQEAGWSVQDIENAQPASPGMVFYQAV